MEKLIVKGLTAALDGEYEFSLAELLESLKNSDYHRIKKESGVRAGEIEDALKAGDNDVLVVLSMIILERAGKGNPDDFREAIWDADLKQVTWVFPKEGKGDAVPPQSEPGVNADTAESSDSSGGDSENDGEKKASTLRAIGTPA